MPLLRQSFNWLLLLMAACASPLLAQTQALSDLRRGFEHPPADARIMVRWWWFGSAVTKPELEREMRQMKEGGIGGIEVQPVYPVELDDPAQGIRNLPWLSDEFLDALRFTGEKAKELGLRMDLTLGSGWPYGGPHVSVNQASSKLRVERVAVPAGSHSLPLPKLAEGEKLIAAFAGSKQLTGIDSGSLHLPAEIKDGGSIEFFIASRTGQMVKRPAVGAEGFVLDHYSRAAIENHLNVAGEKLLKALSATPPYAVFSDSLEVYGADWTDGFLQEFQKRRGYDLTPYLPALSGDIGEKTADIRHDWGQTLTELANDNYLTPLREWAHQHGTRFRSQTYGIPPVALSSNAYVDLPEGEGYTWRKFSATRWAASANHLFGNPVTSSETWTWLHSPVFRATPLDMKVEADLHFLQGVNQLIGHGWPYSPPEAGEPGWRFYAAAVFNHHNPWWMVMPDVTGYLQRISFLLRQGKPANDVAVYLPTDDAWAGFTLGHDSVSQSMDGLIGAKVIPQILDAGYNFDFIDDGAMERVGIPYPILILPNVQRIPPGTLKRLKEYEAKGGIVIATLHKPALEGLRFVGDENLLGAELKAVLRPDVATVPEVGFVHRKLAFADVYFLANTSNHSVHAPAEFRMKGLEGAWWDPFNGNVTRAGGGSKVNLDLAPYESRVIVFSKGKATESRSASGPIPPAMELSADWKLTFASGSREPVTMQALRSWTENEERKNYSGQATYEKTVSIAGTFLNSARSVYLNFGEGTPVEATAAGRRGDGPGMRALLESPVREAAQVYINGKLAGSVWHPPYEVDVTGLLHAGENTIRVVAANLAINEMAGKPLPDYTALNARYGERFRAQDMSNLRPLPSGLLGPVRLVAR